MKNIFCIFFIFTVFASCKSRFIPVPVRQGFAGYEFSKDIHIKDDKNLAFQTDITFPLNKHNYDDSVLTNNFIRFKGYSNRCIIYFHTKNIESLLLYLNGKKIETGNICANEYSAIKISESGINGDNVLQILQIKPVKSPSGNSEEYFLNIKIPYPEITKTKLVNTEVNGRALEAIDNLFEAQIKNGFPSAQLVIIKNGEIIKSSAYGYISTVDDFGKPVLNKKRITTKTLFDLASNTKMFSTNFALQKLVSEKKLSVQDKVNSFFPKFKDKENSRYTGKDEITIADLLNHQAGFPAGAQYYRKKEIRKKAKTEKRTNKEITLNLICETPLVYEPRTRFTYSDIDYMLLGLIIEKVTGMPLDKYVEENIYKPLNLTSVCYKPLEHGFKKKNIAATEIYAVKRSKEKKYGKEKYLPIHGTVHDPEAYGAMDQVSGHAGLFANAESIAVLAQVMLNGGGYGNIKLFDSHVLNFFTSPSMEISAAGLGWRRQGTNQAYSHFFSQLASRDAFGHSGWTGTLTLTDPQEDLIVIIFTSAKHTPALHGSEFRGKYEGDFYLAKNYGAITTLIYSAFKNYSDEILDNMLIELAEQRYALISEGSEFYNNRGFYNDLTAIMDTIKSQSKYSEKLTEFLKSNNAAIITQKLMSVQQAKK
ncbi:penicillin binding protein PBP4B [Treponema pedis]|uniref:Beta-lactamase n=1 Tax=Treponema pedis str. T A4 TaxID=1291379 RepID=S6A7X9_9SPIR|nr:penicillin binding protein PBP4B [Treponema pedis]AGT42864.1 Beta-lactamase [Treponema pedis str. T A4]